jgi:hypothetical protein
MSHANAHGPDHHGDTTGDRPYFSPAEWEEFKQADIQGGRAIVLLMGSIFIIGLFLYSAVAIIVAS